MIAPASSLRGPSLPTGGAEAENPFIPITAAWRRALVAYFAIWLVATPVLQEILLPSATPLAGVRVGLDVLYQTLVFLPLLLYRPSFGWLHPLIFPTLFALASRLVKYPGELLRPLGIGLVPRETMLRIEVISWYPEETIALGEIRLQAVRILAVLAYYAGFFLLRRIRSGQMPAGVAQHLRPARVRAVALAVAATALVGVTIFIATRGGLQAHLLSYWVGGRGSDETTGGLGIASAGLDVSLVALLLWYALQPGAQRNPLFVCAAAATVVLLFLITGSRSDVFNTLVLFVIVWMLRHRKVPTGRASAIAVLALVLLAPLGDFRRSVTQDATVDWGMLVDLKGAVSRTNDEIAMRASRGGGIPVMIRVPSEVDFLNGKSYVGGLLFFVPRIVWKSKPNGAGLYNSTLILGRGSYGAPIPAEAEAYWNFGVAGLIALFLLVGVFHGYLARVFTRYGRDPVTWVPYILALLHITPSSDKLTTGARVLGGSLIILAAMGARQRHRAASRGAPVHGFRAPPVPQSSGT